MKDINQVRRSPKKGLAHQPVPQQGFIDFFPYCAHTFICKEQYSPGPGNDRLIES